MMKTTKKKFLGARIKELRKAKRLSQEQLSDKINIDPKHLSRIEVGNSYPSLDTLDNISKALGIEMKDIFEFAHEATSRQVKSEINKLVQEADDNDLKLVLKILRAIIR
jgi:transcriptional regulator with XRE-family HTH domain